MRGITARHFRVENTPRNEPRSRSTEEKKPMFHIDTTFEDVRIIAHSASGHEYQVVLVGRVSGQMHEMVLSAAQVSMVMQFNLHPDGEPEGFERFYEVLEPLLGDCPAACRPIP